jgi:hypothetical protein
MLPREDVIEVGRLRIRGRASSGGHVGSLDVALRAVDLRPPGFRPSEVLVIRELPDPVPGSVAIGRRTAVPAAWEWAARDRVSELYRHAARPALAPVPPDATAVVFADRSELLAALALDWLSGRAHERWWWTVFARRRPIDGALVARMMIEHATAVPPMLRVIDARGEAGTVVARLGPSASAAVFAAVSSAYGMGALVADLAEAPSTDRPTRHGIAGPGSTEMPAALEEAARPESAPAIGAGRLPWAEHVLVVASLAIARFPRARTEAVRREVVRAWVAPTRGVAPAIAAGVVSRVRRTDVEHAHSAPTSAGGAGSGAPRVTRPSREPTPTDRASSETASASSNGADGAPTHVELLASRPVGQAEVRPPSQHPPAAWADVDRAHAARPTAHEPTVDMTFASREYGFETAFGGVLYLVNVMSHLDLPEIFEPDWRLASGAGSWQTLELLARALLVRRVRHIVDDRIWDALRILDERPQDVPLGAGMVQPRMTGLPDAWIDAKGRPPSAVVAVGSKATTGVFGDLESYASPAACEWVTRVTPYVRWRISRALGPGAGARAVVAALRCQGRIFVSATHVDVELALADISVPVRRAGLDRDPGWQPGFGRVIRYRFR